MPEQHKTNELEWYESYLKRDFAVLEEIRALPRRHRLAIYAMLDLGRVVGRDEVIPPLGTFSPMALHRASRHLRRILASIPAGESAI
jgi:hypothetical protein